MSSRTTFPLCFIARSRQVRPDFTCKFGVQNELSNGVRIRSWWLRTPDRGVSLDTVYPGPPVDQWMSLRSVLCRSRIGFCNSWYSCDLVPWFLTCFCFTLRPGSYCNSCFTLSPANVMRTRSINVIANWSVNSMLQRVSIYFSFQYGFIINPDNVKHRCPISHNITPVHFPTVPHEALDDQRW